MWLDLWVDDNGIIYTQAMLERKAFEHAKAVNALGVPSPEEYAKILRTWIKEYDHQRIFVELEKNS